MLYNPLAWLTGRAVKAALPTMLTVVAGLLIAVGVFSGVSGLVGLVRNEATARLEAAIADGNAAAAVEQSKRNAAAAAAAEAERANTDLAAMATRERERVIELEAHIRDLETDPVLFRAKPKGGK